MKLTSYFTETFICTFDIENYNFGGFHIGFFITSFALPILAIFVMYLVMLVTLWRKNSNRSSKLVNWVFADCSFNTYSACREGMKAKKRVTKLVLAVITVFTGKISKF